MVGVFRKMSIYIILIFGITFRRHRLMAKSPAFQAGAKGSNPFVCIIIFARFFIQNAVSLLISIIFITLIEFF
jgi:hypothetical protein